MQEQRLLDVDWDYLVVLDACRYDAFENVYEEYLDGPLEKRWSKGSSTPEWAAKTFTGDHDIAYFSANPFINSFGIPLNEMQWGASCEYEWTANDHLAEVIDVWKHGWDDDLGTIPPENVGAAVMDHREAIDRADRAVVHYMQPHAPYLTRSGGRKLTQIREGLRNQNRIRNGSTDGSGPLSAVGDVLRPRIERLLEGSELAMKLGLWLELEPGDGTGIWQDGTRETAMEYYEENLRIVLESVVELIEDLDGTVVVTADHGEAFGEQGIWEHHIETHIPALMEVPWLELPDERA